LFTIARDAVIAVLVPLAKLGKVREITARVAATHAPATWQDATLGRNRGTTGANLWITWDETGR
jgi:hypothetical protein